MRRRGPKELASSEPAVRSYLSGRLDPSEVEDATQTVLQRALERLEAYASADRPRAWLLGVARNVAYEVLRARAKGPVSPSGEDEGDADPAPTAEERLDVIERNHRLYQALDGLRLDDQLVLLMTYVDGIPGPEAASMLGIGFAAFRQRLSRARKQAEQRMRALIELPAPVDPSAVRAWSELLADEGAQSPHGAWRAAERAGGRPRSPDPTPEPAERGRSRAERPLEREEG